MLPAATMKIVWLMLYSDSRVCYPYVIRLINKSKQTNKQWMHDDLVSFFLFLKDAHITWTMTACFFVCLFVGLFFTLFIQSLLFWLTLVLCVCVFFSNHFQYTREKKIEIEKWYEMSAHKYGNKSYKTFIN